MEERESKNIDPNFQPTYNCRACKFTFYTKREQLLHRKQVHEAPDALKHRCKECGKGFATLGNLERHVKNHSADSGKFPCKQCDKAFTQMTNLLRHMQTVHSGLRPFECEVCHKTFTQQGNLQRHQLTHTGEKPFRCKRCGRSFSQRINLKKHSMAHQGFRPYKCTECNMSFVQKPNLMKHLQTHELSAANANQLFTMVKSEVEDENDIIVTEFDNDELIEEMDMAEQTVQEYADIEVNDNKYDFTSFQFANMNNYIIQHVSDESIESSAYCEVISEEQVKTSD